MLLPIYIYGSAVLRKESEDIAKDYPELDKFLENLWETMYEADGVGLAAPQVGRNIRIFVVDASVNADKDPSLAGFSYISAISLFKNLYRGPERVLCFHTRVHQNQ